MSSFQYDWNMVLKCSHLGDRDIIWNTIVHTQTPMLHYRSPETHIWGTRQYSQIFCHAPSGPAVHILVPNPVEFIMHLNKTVILPMLQKHLCVHCNQINSTEFIIPVKKLMWTTPFTITSLKAIMDIWMTPNTGLGLVPPSLLIFFAPVMIL